MSSIIADQGTMEPGSLEEQHRSHASYRGVADGTEVAIGVWRWVPEHPGKELNAIIV